MDGSSETHELDEEDRIDVLVATGEWKIAKAPKIIGTHALGPCIGIIIYDPDGKRAMVAHLNEPVIQLKGMLIAAKRHFPNEEKLRVSVVGGSIDIEHLDSGERRRAFVLSGLRDHGFQDSQTTINWLKFSDQTLNISVDTETGEIKHDQIDHSDQVGYN